MAKDLFGEDVLEKSIKTQRQATHRGWFTLQHYRPQERSWCCGNCRFLLSGYYTGTGKLFQNCRIAERCTYTGVNAKYVCDAWEKEP